MSKQSEGHAFDWDFLSAISMGFTFSVFLVCVYVSLLCFCQVFFLLDEVGFLLVSLLYLPV